MIKYKILNIKINFRTKFLNMIKRVLMKFRAMIIFLTPNRDYCVAEIRYLAGKAGLWAPHLGHDFLL